MNFKPEISFGTRIRKSPFFESTMKWGCKGFTVYNKMYMPTYYKSFVDEIHFARGDGHQAVHAISYGVTKYNKAKGEPGIEKLRTYPASCIYPPAGVKSEDWINQGMPGRKCN